MKIAIEAQRIFRKDKHGMDFVILETLKELQKRKDGNEYYVFVAPGEDRCLEESENLHSDPATRLTSPSFVANRRNSPSRSASFIKATICSPVLS